MDPFHDHTQRPPDVPSRRRVLFAMPYPGYLRYFDGVVRELARRGFEVELWFETTKKQPEGLEAVQDVAGVTVAGRLPKRADRYAGAARNARWTFDFLRYLDPRFAGSTYLRRRLATKLPGYLRVLTRLETAPPRLVRRLIRLGLDVERALPTAPAFDRLVRDREPCLVVVSPLVTPASRLTDVVASARAAGIPSVAAIASWDNLTTKGLLRLLPDRVLVWNEAQVEEAVDLHLAPRDRLVATGAQPFDRWFERRPARSAEAFRERVGLPRDRPYLLFVGSTASISDPDAEIRFVLEWLRALRTSDDPKIREIAVLVRPHPYNSQHWPDVDVSAFAPAAVWPRDGANPVNEGDRDDYFDSIHYATAAVGINTSAMLETAIQRKPVFSVALPEFDDTQSGTLHFKHLLPENGGFVRTATSLDEHVHQLGELLRDPDAARAELDGFVGSFLRPHGLDRACTPIVVDALEAVANAAPEAARPLGRMRGVALRLLLLTVFAPPGFRPARWRDRVRRLAGRVARLVGSQLRRARRRPVETAVEAPARQEP